SMSAKRKLKADAHTDECQCHSIDPDSYCRCWLKQSFVLFHHFLPINSPSAAGDLKPAQGRPFRRHWDGSHAA
ncbi:MAG: hypothetical protein ACKO45_04580, partial [Cyanobium sp.]